MESFLEIKCPYSAAKLTVREAFCTLDEGSQISLDSNHLYYYQILGTMALTNASFCDFIVWTPKSIKIINIKFDEPFWKRILPVLKHFYINYMLPCILY